jgi:hypothetical protein
MLEDYFNTDIVSKMTFKEFETTYRGNLNLVRLKIDMKDAFRQLGGKIYKAKKFKKSED